MFVSLVRSPLPAAGETARKRIPSRRSGWTLPQRCHNRGNIMSIDHARHEHHDFLNASTAALADVPLQAALVRLTNTLMAGNRRGFAALADSSDLRDHA